MRHGKCAAQNMTDGKIPTHRRREHTLRAAMTRVRGEFLEMPGMRLTLNQAAKLMGVDVDTAAELLSSLVRVGFLRDTPDGFIRA